MEDDDLTVPLVQSDKGTSSRRYNPQTTDAEERPAETLKKKNGSGLLLKDEAGTAPLQICSQVEGKHLTCSGAACPWMTNDAEERSEDMKKLSRAVIFCLIFMLVEVMGGIKAGSLAILTDAAHLLSDVASFAISLFAMWAGGWEANARQTYGFYRLEILGALVSILIIWLITGIIIYEAISRLFGDSLPIDGRLMFIIAALGLLVNLVMMFLLDHGHGHGHGHSHGSGGGSHEHSHEAGNHYSRHHSHGHSYSHEKSRASHSELAHSHDHHHGGEHVAEDDEHSPDHHDDKHVHAQDEAKNNHDHSHDHDGHHHGRGEGPHMDHSSSSDRMYHDAASILKQRGHNSECVRTNITRSPRSTAGDTIVMCICDEIEKRSEAEKSVRVTIDHGGDREGHHDGSTGGNINVRGAYLHVLGDFIQSIGVMIGGAIIWYNPTWKIVDLICTFLFSALVLGTTIKMIRDILEVLMESTPREIDAGALERGLMDIEGVTAVHELHIWAITVGKVVLACHVMIEPDADSDDLLHEVIQYCDQKYKISHVTVQIERDKHERVFSPLEIDALKEGLMAIEGVLAVHKLRFRTIPGAKVVLACHVMIEPDANSDDLLLKVIQYCDHESRVSHVAVQFKRDKHERQTQQ